MPITAAHHYGEPTVTVFHHNGDRKASPFSDHSSPADLDALYDILLLFAMAVDLSGMPDRWCTVTVTDAEGRRHSLDVIASSTYDAAHLYVAHAKQQPDSGLPIPDVATTFEVVTAGKLYLVTGSALHRWIEQRRHEWKGPKGLLFSRRPTLR